ncbi:MAG: diphthamide synthesis protein, partial [Nitrososphaerales archaeon]
MIRLDCSKVLEEVDKSRSRSVLVVAPDGLLKEAQKLVDALEAKGVEAIVSGEACYGPCDLKEDFSEGVKADLIIHIGHTLCTNRIGRRTILISAEDDVRFETVIYNAAENLKKYKKIGLYTISQHLHRLPEAKKLFEELGFKVKSEGGEKLRYGQILGCEFQTAYSVKDSVEAFVFLGQSRFHAIGLSLSTGKPTYMLDPYLDEVIDVTPLAEEAWRRSLLAVYKARDAERFGIIIGLRGGQMRLHHVKRIRSGLLNHGKSSTLIAMREITPERVNT